MLLHTLKVARSTPGKFRLDVGTYAKKPAKMTGVERQHGLLVTAASKKVARELCVPLRFAKRAHISRWGRDLVASIHAPYSGYTQMARRVTWHELAHATCGYPGLDREMGNGRIRTPSSAREEVRAELAALTMVQYTEEKVEQNVLDMSLNYISRMLSLTGVPDCEHAKIANEVVPIVNKLKEIANAYS